ncbi:hypothetical protein ACLKA6_018878 [Drosophila palustris]
MKAIADMGKVDLESVIEYIVDGLEMKMEYKFSMYNCMRPKGLAGGLPGPNWLSKLLDLTRSVDPLADRLLSVDSPPAQDLPPAALDLPPAGQDLPPAAHDPPSETSMDFSVLRYDFNENGDLIKQI